MRNERIAPPPQAQAPYHHELKALDLVTGSVDRAAAVEAERSSARAQRTKQRRHIKDMEKLGYEVVGTAPDGNLTFRKVKTWQGETADHASNGGPSEANTSSHGQSKAALASAQRLQRNAKKLKSSSANGSKRGAARAGRVIPLKSS